MTYKVQEWVDGEVFIRDATPEEITQHEIDALANSKAQAARANKVIRTQLDANDIKAIRAILENDQDRIQQYLIIQADLRAQLVPE